MVRYGFVMDLNRCQACGTCVVACKMANLTGPGVQWIKLYKVEQRDPPDVWWLPFHCMHCDNAPCVFVCPTGASYKDERGVVLVDYSKCIACGLCISACPYDAREIVRGDTYYPTLLPFEEKGVEEGGYRVHYSNVVEKCTMCIDNPETLEYGPACVRHCPTGARMWGDLDNPDSQVAKLVASGEAKPLLPQLGTKPKVYYIGLPDESVLSQLPIKARYVIPPPRVETVTQTRTVTDTVTKLETTTQTVTQTTTLTQTIPHTVTEKETITETKTSAGSVAAAAVGGLVIGALATYAARKASGEAKKETK